MSRVFLSAALPEHVHQAAVSHLVRDDEQEDLCFALWRPSQGRHRRSVLIQKLILPEGGERNVHGNASFEPSYFERALAEAAAAGAGLALLHSHPRGSRWQGMSTEDIEAEKGHAAAAFGATRMPLAGLTIAGYDRAWSCRLWERTAPRQYQRVDCGSVRVVGDALTTTYYDCLVPSPQSTREQVRTVSCWGERRQADLARTRVGIVGAGSVGGFIAEALARTGLQDVALIDFDHIEERNLDRLVYASRRHVGELKVECLAKHLGEIATAKDFNAEPIVRAVYEEDGFRAALDCDVLVSCVDRPWGRQVMDLIAYAHLIPVVDGGIAVRKNRKGDLVKADWRAHTAMVGRQCLACIGQFDPGHVEVERAGLLDDPTYIENLAADHPLRASENVFAFSMACASQQILQLLSLILSPLDQPNPGAQLYHFVGGKMEDPAFDPCHLECLSPTIIALGDHCPYLVTGERPSIAEDRASTPQSPSGNVTTPVLPPAPLGLWARLVSGLRKLVP